MDASHVSERVSLKDGERKRGKTARGETIFYCTYAVLKLKWMEVSMRIFRIHLDVYNLPVHFHTRTHSHHHPKNVVAGRIAVRLCAAWLLKRWSSMTVQVTRRHMGGTLLVACISLPSSLRLGNDHQTRLEYLSFYMLSARNLCNKDSLFDFTMCREVCRQAAKYVQTQRTRQCWR